MPHQYDRARRWGHARCDHVDATSRGSERLSTLALRFGPELEQLGVVVERLPIGVIIFTKARLEVVFANDAARRLLHPVRVRRGEPLPDPWPSFSLRAYAERVVEPGVVTDGRVDVGDDRTYVVSGIVTRKTNTGVILIEDVSARERRLRAEREFISNAAHELLTPLTGIVGAAHVLESGAKEVPEDRDRFIAHIGQECARLTKIARAMLVLARVQSGEEPPRLDVFPLCDLLDEIVELSTSDSAVRIVSDCDPGLSVLADVDLFTQAMTNLVRNAVRHGSGEEVRLTAIDDHGKVLIDIVDPGSRMHQDEFALLGRRFRSAGGRDGGGFGLGLSIAAQSLEAMGGTLRLAVSESVAARVEVPSGHVTE